ncbi:ribonuclease E/G [Bacillus sp. AGMB 02131]|uniref:Ribonuclease E/G n=1 Tax=Peribacillus faecalis TaxID=2772559 RepID=A0A927HAE4_9BACI|nr:ribonuclease E/G [Peribacillus faecalis]MBD3107844.1 ribonuclease E/G [Peribacillus faecalis]
MKNIIVNLLSREQRFAVLEQDKLEQIVLYNESEESLVGNVYVGRIEKLVPGMDAAFVNFGRQKNGFLHKGDLLSAIGKGKETPINQLVTQGEKLLIQVIRDETEHKGARVTGIIEVSTPSFVYSYGQKHIAVSKKLADADRERWRMLAEKHREDNEGMLIRTEMNEKDEAFFIGELEQCRNVYQEWQKQLITAKSPVLLYKKNHLLSKLKDEMKFGSGSIYVDDYAFYQQLQKETTADWELKYERDKENIFSRWNIDDQLNKLYKRIVWLPNGSFLVIEEGEAMTTIDVNTGKFTGKQDKERTIAETNRLAAIEAMKQIKLRNISGIILIDFINCSNSAGQKRIVQEVAACAKRDKQTIQVIGFTELGVLQLTRKVQSGSLLQSTTSVCPTCEGLGRVESAQSAAFRLERELMQYRQSDYSQAIVEVTKDVLIWYSGENAVYKQKLEENIGLGIEFQIIEAEKPYYHIKQLN